MRKLLAAIAIAVVMLVGGLANAGGVCSPGQQGNPHPGFKPAVCLHK